MAELVKIQLDDGPIGSCPVDVLPVWEARGYHKVDTSETDVEAPTNEEVVVHEATDLEVAGRILAARREGVKLYDPAEHTVSEVTDYLEGADDIEFSRVIDAESAGKNRKTIVELAEIGPDQSTPATSPDTAPAVTTTGETSTAGADAEHEADGASVTSSEV